MDTQLQLVEADLAAAIRLLLVEQQLISESEEIGCEFRADIRDGEMANLKCIVSAKGLDALPAPTDTPTGD